MTREKSQRQQGQSVIIVAVIFVALLIFAAIAADVGNGYYNRRTAQNAADAAALAGGRQLAWQINEYGNSFAPGGDTPIKADMDDFAERNGISDSGGALGDATNKNVVGFYLDEEGNRLSSSEIGTFWSVPANTMGIEAITYITATTFFGGLFGIDGLPLTATASVLLEGTCSVTCVVPIATYDLDQDPDMDDFVPSPDPDPLPSGGYDWASWLTEGRCYNIWNGSGPGNFGWLNWSLQGRLCQAGDCSSNCLADNLAPQVCESGWIKVGDLVAGSTGTFTIRFSPKRRQGVQQKGNYGGR